MNSNRANPRSSRLAAKIDIDDVCDRFEAAWNDYLQDPAKRSAPQLGNFLETPNKAKRPDLLEELLPLELYFRAKLGQACSSDHYRDQFPEAQDVVAKAMQRHQQRSAGELFTKLPATLGRYQIVERIAAGGFANVYRAVDDTLQRPVALKVANLRQVKSNAAADELLDEARLLAQLRHPNIVAIHDVDTTAEGLCFIVTELIDGNDLATMIKADPPGFELSGAIVASIADALHFAHTNKIVHRDVKPGNILLDDRGRPFLTDFGLALHDADFGKLHKQGGTVAYMSPEQARGEGHLVDGRSDIFSLGVVLYQLLTGVLPFRGKTSVEILYHISHTEPRPLRMINDCIPASLERICLKAMSKRATDRYLVAKDFAQDLRACMEQLAAPKSSTENEPTNVSHLPIIPKGLRAFDSTDAAFFTSILPGPLDASGVPESIRFWLAKIEAKDAPSFRVGLLYGPSGSGKSSLVKAGVLPRLNSSVVPIYVEATAATAEDSTEARLFRSLKKRIPEIADQPNLAAAIASLRRKRNQSREKILIVLDQFEQWLHTKHTLHDDPSLIEALRQCDGDNVQCLILVRDDYWSPVSQFMRDLEIPIVDGDNAQAVELFAASHARRVLSAFGRAYGKLPEREAELSRDQELFIQRSVNDLTHEGRVMPIRLALFCEMVKHRPWTSESYRQIGGSVGVGILYFESIFASSSAPPQHRMHLSAVQSTLSAMLPDLGSNLKGHVCSAARLRQVSGYANSPQDFQELLRILDHELRVITPSGPIDRGDASSNTSDSHVYYQLTHDYLIPSLRQWLTARQRSTMRGRAQLRLDESTQLWQSHGDRRHIPGFLEFLSLRAFTSKRDWNTQQREMMRVTGRRYAVWMSMFGLLIVAFTYAGIRFRDRVKTNTLVDGLLRSEISQVSAFTDEIADVAGSAEPHLRDAFQDPHARSRQRTRAALVLTRLYDDTQANHDAVEFLREQLLTASPEEVVVVCESLENYKEQVGSQLWPMLLEEKKMDPVVTLRTMAALKQLFPDDARWQAVKISPIEVLSLLPNTFLVERWLKAFQRDSMLNLDHVFRILDDAQSSPQQRVRAVDIAITIGEHDWRFLSRLIQVCDDDDVSTVVNLLLPHGSQSVKTLQRSLSEQQAKYDDTQLKRVEKTRIAKRITRLLLAMAKFQHMEPVWDVFAEHHQINPDLTTSVIHDLAAHRCDAQPIADRLAKELANDDQNEDLVICLCQALGEFRPSDGPNPQPELVQRLWDAFHDHPDSGVHSSVEWLLRRWGQQQAIEQAVHRLKNGAKRRGWFVNGQGQTMAIVHGRTTMLGARDNEPVFEQDEIQRDVTIPRIFAISTHEVTKKQFQEFDRDYNPPDNAPDDSCPITGVSWYQAVAYCNWLSERELIPESEWCYQKNSDGEYGDNMTMAPDYLSKRGYRLSTDPEWEFTSRAGTDEVWFFGDDRRWLVRYAWFEDNSSNGGTLPPHCHPVGTLKPNRFGMFDIIGNAWEWTQESKLRLPVVDREDDVLTILGNVVRTRRGGGYTTGLTSVRPANRSGKIPAQHNAPSGFRVVRTIASLPESD